MEDETGAKTRLNGGILSILHARWCYFCRSDEAYLWKEVTAAVRLTGLRYAADASEDLRGPTWDGREQKQRDRDRDRDSNRETTENRRCS